MSFLLLKAPDCDPSLEVISGTHKRVIDKESPKEVLEGSSFWSTLGQTSEPLHGGRTEGDTVLKVYTPGLIEPQAGVFEFDNDQHQANKDSESGQVRTERAGGEEQHVSKESFEDGLVCKLLSQFCVPPESSNPCPQELERELKELSLTATNFNASVSCLEGDSLQHASPPLSLDGPSAIVHRSEGLLSQPSGDPSGDVTSLSIKSNGGPAKLRSALKGSYEKAGLGSRPKVHVTWAPYVYDPPCTSTSHTSSQNHRKHHHPRIEHKNSRKGKGSSHTDSHKKSQKKMARKSKHSGETLLSFPTVFSQRGIMNNTLKLKEFIAPLEDLTWKSAKVRPLILPPKGCFLNPVISLGERDLITF